VSTGQASSPRVGARGHVLARLGREAFEEVIEVAVALVRQWNCTSLRGIQPASTKARRSSCARTGRGSTRSRATRRILNRIERITHFDLVGAGADQQARRGRGVNGTPMTSFG
jgi:hypothetical protein